MTRRSNVPTCSSRGHTGPVRVFAAFPSLSGEFYVRYDCSLRPVAR